MIASSSWVNTWIPLALGVLLSGTSAYSEDKQTAPDPVELIRQASLAAKTNLRSGSGKAIFEKHVKMPNEREMKLVRKADCTILFDRDKYFVRLDFVVDESSKDKTQIVVCDGKAIITNEISPLFHPNGAQGAIFPIRGGNIRSYSSDVPINPSKLQEAIMDADEAIKRFNIDIRLNKANGMIEGIFRAENIIQQFVAGPAAGYNVERRTILNTNVSKTEPVTEFSAKWEQKDGVWYIRSLQETFKSEDGLNTRTLLEYTSFLPNVPVPAEQFHLNALKFAKGVRILDHRPGAPVRSYEYGLSRETDPSKLDTLVGQVESMPIRHLAPAQPPAKSGRWQWALISTGAVVTLAGTVLVGRRYWVRRASMTKTERK